MEDVDFLEACRILAERFSIPPPLRLKRAGLRQEIKLMEQAGDIEQAKVLVLKLQELR
jgi:hypothetical protein